MADATLTATTRTEFGKGAARRLRRAGQTPAVLYGHGTDPVHLALSAQEAFLALRTANVLLEITVEGEKKPVLALPKQVQRDPISPVIEHIDLLLVKAGEKVTVDVPLVLVGEAERRDGQPRPHRAARACPRHQHPQRDRGLDRGPGDRRADPRLRRRAA